ncbi:hypothetical protein XIS1_210015 [Xenorhabdus innexi]|uniref:Uncharacterized protein n=1 Tax=Xenorhabdus innexi TaxID=290109 RepID=A0A1N6MX74_9GAMM|nr:hypothetical protein XIS1_210015 [Xenorhabdus innexi]
MMGYHPANAEDSVEYLNHALISDEYVDIQYPTKTLDIIIVLFL